MRARIPGRLTGMTLIEVLTALLILSLVTGALSKLLMSAWESQDTLTGQNLMQKHAQQAADAVVDRLRGASEITAGNATQVAAAYKSGGSVTYYLQDGALMCDSRPSASGQTTTNVICRDVSNLGFAYYVRSGATWATPATAVLAESVKVSVTVASGKDKATESSVVDLRNKGH
jgi:prepilin-type N-terminal cleavage/methylation domain-containing protein